MSTEPVAATRTNAEWLDALRSSGPAREAALADLRRIVLTGLAIGLANWRDTAGPAFEPLLEDVAQEALLRVLAHLETFEGRSQFTTWVHKIAIRVGLTELRRRRWKEVSLEAVLEREGHAGAARLVSPAAAGPEAAAEQADMLSRLERIMHEELTPRQWRAMRLTATTNMPLEEIARRMGTNRNALYKLLHDGRVRLKRRLARDGLTTAELLTLLETR